MKTKLLVMALAGIALAPAVIVRAQVGPGPFDDLLNTWVPFENAEGDPPIPIEITQMDLSPSPIPADFFGPGSDPFGGVIPLRGLHDGTQPGNTDTIIRRQIDPVQPTDPPGTSRTIPIEIIQLSLVSAQPITVTSASSSGDSFFDVFVELSSSAPSVGQLTATKVDNNGGTFDSFFDIIYRMTFTNVNDPTDVRVFDSGLAGQPPLHLEIRGAPWVHQVTIPELIVDPASQFHPFVQDDGTGVQTEAPVTAQTPPGAVGPIVVHFVCLPKIEPMCIYQMDCKAAPPGDLISCPFCPFNCKLYQGAPCPNGTCAVGVSTFCGVAQCCLDFALVACRAPLGEPPLPPLTAACVCNPVLGACCNQADGTCTQTTECACAGTWEGPGTVCGPAQGCCLPDGTCLDGVPQICCESMGGVSTPGVCSGVLGKCCLDDGTCTDGVDQLCCAGSWIAGGICLPPEECCFGLSCLMMDPECCAAMGGSPGGPGSVCDPVQKCCFAGGSCANVEPDCCTKASGTPGVGLCQTPQACCLPDDTCVELDPDCCAQQGGISHLGPCQPPQACCDPLTQACQMLEPRCCVDSGGTPEGAGTSCTPTGSCCWDSDGDLLIDMCQSNMAKECCNDFSTSVFHAGVDCAPVGACCFDGDLDGTNESCTQISETCCADLPGGSFNGAGSVCLGDNNGNGIDDSCESAGGNCPLANSWCQSLVSDCVGGAAGDQCWPRHLHTTNQQFPIIDQCGCFGNTCGPIDIQSIGVPPMDYSIRCVNTCPTPGEACVIHYNGLPTSFSGVLASQVPIWVDVSCGCPSVTTDTCPLPPGMGIPDPCKDLQLTDCQNGTAADVCLPKVVVITSSGIPIAKTCSCFTPGPECGPPTITGDIVSCQGTCPAPQTGVCVVHADGVSTHLVSVHMGDVPVGADLTCGCSEPPPTDCRPNAAATDCDPVNCPVAGDNCRPKCMAVDPLTGAVSVVDCNCVGLDECHVEIDPLTAQPACVGSCPAGQHCEETRTTDPATGVETVCCNCVDNTICEPTADGLACEPTHCADLSQTCLPNVIAVNPLTGQVIVIDCDCVDKDACHVEFDAAQQPFCTGTCPPGETCELFSILSPDGTVAYQCDCVPVQVECAPNDIGSDCLPTVCPYPNEICRPTLIAWTPITPPVIKDCDCVDPGKKCHVEFDAATGPMCVGQCPPGETCQLFGIDTDNDGERDLWSCDCVPVIIECGPDPTQTYCNPATCPAADEFCVPNVLEIDPVNGQVRVVECECIKHGVGSGCHVNYDPATLAPFCEGGCPPGQICTLFGKDVNGDGTNDQFHCDCVPDTIDCGPTPDGLACNPIACPDPTQTCTPKVIQVLPGTAPVVLVCDCIDPIADCHVEFTDAQGPHCVGGCPPGQTCELRSVDTDGDGQADTFGCDCVPDTGTVCEPNATATDCKATVCPVPGEVCRPVLVAIGPNGQTKVAKCDCVDPKLDCHVEFDAASAPYCTGTCPPGETCELLGLDINGDGIDDLFQCQCVPPTLECQPDSTGLDCKPTICPIPGDICRPKVMHWVLGLVPEVQECECVSSDECHIEFDAAAQQPFCTGGCPPGEECKLSAKDTDNDGMPDRWECVCVPPSVECSPLDDGTACRDTVCPVAGEICLPSVIGLLGGIPIVQACDCVSPNACHLEFDAAAGPMCVGVCPPGKICKLFSFIDAAGLEHYQCRCIPDTTVCQPTADGQTCSQAACPVAGQTCVPTHVSCLPGVACMVSQCDCGDPTQCHVNLAPPQTNPPAVCEGTCPPGHICVLKGTDTNSDGIRDDFECICIVKPIIVAVDDAILKSRFISLIRSVGSVAGVTSEAIRVRAVSVDGFPAFNGESRWLGVPLDFPEEDSSNPGLTFKASRLECDPLFRDWSADGVVQVYGGMLVPSSQYVVQAVDISCPDLQDENCYSDVATITTGLFGDIVDPFFVNPTDVQPDFKDISAAVAKFLGDPSAPIKARVQMQPNTPFVGRPIDFKDISTVVRAFLGEAYAAIPGLSGPCPCPSTVTCGATACTTDTVCNGGLCVDGFCRDACQHCTP